MAKETQTSKVAIVGLGLIGGSIGLGLKAAGFKHVAVHGYDDDHGVAKRAQRAGAVDQAHSSLRSAVEGAQMVIVAVPILSVREVFAAMAPHLAEGAIVTDTASTKAGVMRWAREVLPPGVSFVGGHPMAGKETAGLDNAEAALFQGKAWCICPDAEAEPAAISSVTGLAQVLGAEPVYLDPDEHDQYAAAVSHMPLVVSTALFTLIRQSPSWTDLGAMASSGFRDLTRLASGDPALAHGMWRTNREAMIHWIERMMAELGRYRDMLKDAQDEQLLETFAEAQIERDTFLREPPRRRPIEESSIDRRRAFMEMFIGGLAADSIRKAEKLPELMRQKVAEPAAEGERPKKRSLADRIAEDIKRDLEKLEEKRAQEEQRRARED